MDPEGLRQDLLAWYDAHRRDLPWRRPPHHADPYAVLVSEMMLQQTRVDVALPYFERWMARWPTAHALAAADDETVAAQWAGLGYYRRARNLHAAAKTVAADGWPDDLQELPGVGPYVAGALASIGFGLPAVAVDGNVQRVLARLFDVQDDVTKAAGRNAVHAAATQLLGEQRPGDWTQALMELGATVCAPASPDCVACPVQRHCTASDPASLPVKPRRTPPRQEVVRLAVVQRAGSVLLVRRPDHGLLGGTWVLPGGTAHEPLGDQVAAQTGCHVRFEEATGHASHTFSHRRWDMEIHVGRCVGGKAHPGARWVAWEELDRLGISTAMRKALAAAPVSVPQAH